MILIARRFAPLLVALMVSAPAGAMATPETSPSARLDLTVHEAPVETTVGYTEPLRGSVVTLDNREDDQRAVPRFSMQKSGPWVALVLGAVADVVTTRQAMRRGCVEGNTVFYGRHPSWGRLIALHALAIGVEWPLLKRAPALGYVTGGLFTAAAVHNATISCHP